MTSITRRRLLFAIAVVAIPATLEALSQNPRDAAVKPPVGTASITGTVVTDDVTPSPVRRARVTVRSDAYGNGWSATTDDEGRFAIGALPAGRYSVQASKPSWLVANYGSKRPGRPGTPIAVGDGEAEANVKLVMSRGAVATGTVRDRSGEPVPGVTVIAMRWGYSDVTGERALQRAATALTDDQGTYRCFGLLPGDYVINASLRVGAPNALLDLRRVTSDEVAQTIASARAGAAPAAPAPPPNPPRPQLVGYAPVYFPGTVDLARATTVKIATSEEKAGLNIVLDPVPTARVEAAPTLPDNANRQTLQVYLLNPQATDAGAAAMAVGRRDPDGRIVFGGISPGNYTVIARAGLAGVPATGRGGTLPSAMLTLYASVDVVVEGRDVSVALDLQPGLTVSGKVTFADPERAPKDAGISVALVPLRSGPALSVPPAKVAEDGTFRIAGVPTGKYRIDYSSAPSLDAWRLVSATSRDREVMDVPLDIRGGEDVGDLTLHFTDRPSELAGKLQTETGQPATGYSIVVFSASREFWTPLSRRVRSLRPATDGGFSVRGLPAGEYYIAALTDIEPGEQYDPAVLATLVPTAAKVVVRDGARTVQDLMIK